MNAPWLFAEAYKYRRLRECFSVSKYWSSYDVFFRQKASILPSFRDPQHLTLTGLQCDTFSRSNEAVFELSTRFCEEVQLANHLSSAERLEALRLMFIELTQGKHAAYTEVLIL